MCIIASRVAVLLFSVLANTIVCLFMFNQYAAKIDLDAVPVPRKPGLRNKPLNAGKKEENKINQKQEVHKVGAQVPKNGKAITKQPLQHILNMHK